MTTTIDLAYNNDFAPEPPNELVAAYWHAHGPVDVRLVELSPYRAGIMIGETVFVVRPWIWGQEERHPPTAGIADFMEMMVSAAFAHDISLGELVLWASRSGESVQAVLGTPFDRSLVRQGIQHMVDELPASYRVQIALINYSIGRVLVIRAGMSAVCVMSRVLDDAVGSDPLWGPSEQEIRVTARGGVS